MTPTLFVTAETQEHARQILKHLRGMPTQFIGAVDVAEVAGLTREQADTALRLLENDGYVRREVESRMGANSLTLWYLIDS